PERVHRAADDLQPGEVGLAGPGLEQRAEGGNEVGLVLTVAELELPPVPVAGDVHEGGGTGRAAYLPDPLPRAQRGRGPDVDDQPAFGEPQVLHVDADQPPDGAVGAVAAEYQAAGEGAGGLVGHSVGVDVYRWGGQRAVGAVDRVDFDAAVQVDQGMLAHPLAQQGFQVGLVEHVGPGKAVVGRLGGAAELGHHPVPGVEQAQPAGGSGGGQEGVADADAVQGAGDLVVEVDRAGRRGGRGGALDQGDREGEVGERQRAGAADRAGADDDDLAGIHGGGVLPVGRVTARW